ncbi:MAG: hypothetical protein ABSD92_12860 [Candidatus Bathyarchaeia archaeon]
MDRNQNKKSTTKTKIGFQKKPAIIPPTPNTSTHLKEAGLGRKHTPY